MKTHPHLLAVSLLASAAAFAGAAAQTADQGLDLEAIRARAASSERYDCCATFCAIWYCWRAASTCIRR